MDNPGGGRAQRRRPTIAKEWQLAVLKKLQSESGNPTEEQRIAAAAETGLDTKWVRNWFTRQRSKLGVRNRKCQLATTESYKFTATVPTFRLRHCYPPAVPAGPQVMPSHTLVSAPVDPPSPSPPCLGPRSPCPSPPSVDTQAIPRLHRTISASLSLSNVSQDPALVSHTVTIPTYSRDPLRNRYPDFSQFFCPQVHERFCPSQLLTRISNYDLIQLLANRRVDAHVPTLPRDLFDQSDPLCLGALPADQSLSTNLQPCPVAFSMKLVDLLGHPSLTRYPIFPLPEPEHRV